MTKQITEWAYWVGLVCTAVAVVWRGLSFLGLGSMELGSGGRVVGTITLYKAALLFFVMAIASASHARSAEQK